MGAEVPVGIAQDRVSGPVLDLAGEYLAEGGFVFVDTGAFGAFRHGTRLAQADFDRHFASCLRLASQATPGRLLVVAPDVIGDQAATLDLIRANVAQLTELSNAGAVVITPLQKGTRSVGCLYSEIQGILPDVELSAGLPSNASALGSEEVLSFLSEERPGRVHFLGAARSRRFRNLLADSRATSPSTIFTYDAAVIRSICSEISRTDDRVHCAALEALNSGEIDWTEHSPYMTPEDPVAVQAFADVMNITLETALELLPRLIEHGDRDEDAEGFDEKLSYMDAMFLECWNSYVNRYAEVAVSGTWRTRALSAHPSFRDDPSSTQELLFAA